MRPTLYLGNKNYSSWSLRPWLALRWAGIPFDEAVLRLGADGYGQGRQAHILAVSPSGRVPALRIGDTVIWDSLAICEWAAEQVPSLWPADPLVRAEARSAVAEMHSGFSSLRRDLSMNLRRRTTGIAFPEDTGRDIARVLELWTGLLARHRGPWLFGTRTLADAFYAPVATRFRTYGVALPADAARYAGQIFADADFQAWEAAAAAEDWSIPATDALYASATR